MDLSSAALAMRQRVCVGGGGAVHERGRSRVSVLLLPDTH